MKEQAAIRLWLRTGIYAAMLFCASQPTFAAGVISGSVRNETTGQPAAGDEVILLRLDRSPHEEARAKIDALGQFSFDLPDPGSPHVIRVVHQGVTYDKQVAGAGGVIIDVFDAAAKVQGITGNIEIIRAGTRGSALHVSDMIEIWNQSNPPVTQAGKRSFEVYLPPGASIDSILAASPDNMASTISATLVPGDPGHYLVNYPLLPGATKFAFNYDLPYKGQAILSTKSIYPFKQLAVMFPPTMAFVSKSSAFHALPVGSDRYHVEAAENVTAGADLEFEISGAGELPAAHQQSTGAPSLPLAAPISEPPATTDVSPTEIAVPTARSQRKIAAYNATGWWFVLGAALLTLAVYAYLVWRRHSLQLRRMAFVTQLRSPLLQSPVTLVNALKEGLFQLESDRIQGIIC
ncbi:MAG: hypothetical protein WBP85_00495, partial [Terracidiphilus sp.]